MYDPSDPVQVKERGGKAKAVRRQELDDLRALLASPSGRRFVWRLLDLAGVFRSSFVAGQADLTAYHEGRRVFGLTLVADLEEIEPGAVLALATQQREEV